MPDPTIRTSPAGSPNYALYRQGVAAVDNLTNVPKAHGMNMSTYDRAHIQVMPAGGANPTVRVYYWSEEASAFIQSTEAAVAGVGADTPHEFTVECRGRIMFVAVTVLAGGTVDIAVSGSRVFDQPSA